MNNYAKKVYAEKAAMNVFGVKAIAMDIIVDTGKTPIKSDSEIAAEILNIWKTNAQIPAEGIQIKVEEGWVKMDGQVPWNYQKLAAQMSLINLKGIKGITNLITIRSNLSDTLEKQAVEAAFNRSWLVGQNDIHVSVAKDVVKLTGKVRSLYQKEEAERLAWNAKGVSAVENKLSVID